MTNFWKVVNDVIERADILLLVLDARLIAETRNPEIESKVLAKKKPLIYVVTKSDLVGKEKAELAKKELKPCVFVSAKEHLGTSKLRERIMIEASRAYPDKDNFWVGVLGYPNVGKSSLINSMKGKGSASTSSMSGHTKGMQKIKSDNRILFLDTPGVIPYKEKNESKHASVGSLDFTKVKEPDLAVYDLMEKFPGKIEAHYGFKIGDPEEVIEKIAIDRQILKKGSTPDIDRTARMILRDWQKGNIR